MDDDVFVCDALYVCIAFGVCVLCGFCVVSFLAFLSFFLLFIGSVARTGRHRRRPLIPPEPDAS
jgi:hypothetical protein